MPQLDKLQMEKLILESRLIELDDQIKKESIPKIIDAPDLTELDSMCNDYINWYVSEEYHEDSDGEWRHYFYESVMKTFFGKDIFDWMNELDKKRGI